MYNWRQPYTWRQPLYLKATSTLEGSLYTWRQPLHLKATSTPEGSLFTGKQPLYLMAPSLPNGSLFTWRQPLHLKVASIPGDSLYTWRQPLSCPSVEPPPASSCPGRNRGHLLLPAHQKDVTTVTSNYISNVKSHRKKVQLQRKLLLEIVASWNCFIIMLIF